MPVEIKGFRDGIARQVATKDELLDFINKFRAASGQDLIPDLFPSVPCDEEKCLVALGVNQGCYVSESAFQPQRWSVNGFGETPEFVEKTAAVLGLKFWFDGGDEVWEIILPEEIGNAAHAFDEKLAFQEYNILLQDSAACEVED